MSAIPDTKIRVQIRFVSPRQGSVGQKFRHLAVVGICCRHVANIPSQAWDDTALKMQEKNVISKNGLYWGRPQVLRLKWKCTGTPTSCDKHNYLTEYRVKDRYSEYPTQCDSIIIITVKKAKEWAKAELEVENSFVNLFGLDSSQSQRSDDDPLSPPP